MDEHNHDHGHPHTHTHPHEHSAEEKKAVLNRLSRIAGHLEAVRGMVERGEDCSAVLIQLAAIRSAVNSCGKLVLKNHIDHCIVEAVEAHDGATIAALEEAIDKFVK